MRKVKNEFMAAWDGLRTKEKDRVLVMGATNRPQDLDEAVVRRMPRRLMVDLPDARSRCVVVCGVGCVGCGVGWWVCWVWCWVCWVVGVLGGGWWVWCGGRGLASWWVLWGFNGLMVDLADVGWMDGRLQWME